MSNKNLTKCLVIFLVSCHLRIKVKTFETAQETQSSKIYFFNPKLNIDISEMEVKFLHRFIAAESFNYHLVQMLSYISFLLNKKRTVKFHGVQNASIY